MNGDNKKPYHVKPHFLFALTLGSVFLVELLVMTLLRFLPNFPPVVEAFFDAFLLSLLVLPFLYFFVFKPIKRTIEERNKKEIESNTLRRLDTLKNEFISIAAHELRTPVATIMGYTELLSDQEVLGSFSEQQKEAFLKEVYLSGEQLDKIVDDILDVSHIESGQGLPLYKKPASIKELLGKILKRLSLRSSRRVILEVSDEVPEKFEFDEQRIDQVVENLLSNAIKYSSEEDSIKIIVEVDQRRCTVAVIDSGIGMSDEQQAHIFDKFYRADYSNTAVRGLGLGMSIVRQIIDDHDGTIWVRSQLGEGTRVCFSLPLSQH
jgi:signal transduction histidine kinase